MNKISCSENGKKKRTHKKRATLIYDALGSCQNEFLD